MQLLRHYQLCPIAPPPNKAKKGLFSKLFCPALEGFKCVLLLTKRHRLTHLGLLKKASTLPLTQNQIMLKNH
jgi:hypothetical protein